MKEMLHLITEPLKRAPFPNGPGDTAFLQLAPAQLTPLGPSQQGQDQLLLCTPAGSDLTSDVQKTSSSLSRARDTAQVYS